MMSAKTRLRYIDIGFNLTDPVFRGVHHGRKRHEDDLQSVLSRATDAGVESMIITGGSLQESGRALRLARGHNLYATVGCHPTRSGDFDQYPGGPGAYLQALDKLIQDNLSGRGRVVALGELGLDYDRLHRASQQTQRTHFRSQLSLAKKYHLPLFLHSRAAHKDFVTILREEGFGENGGSTVGGKGGVVHSFTGTEAEMAELIQMGFYISLNGCSLKTGDNLKTAKAVPLEKLMLETDAPWCSMTSTHASKRYLDSMPADLRTLHFPQATKPENFEMGKPVKGRNEPCAIGGVAWVIHKLHDVPLDQVSETAWMNTVRVFGLDNVE